MLGQLVCKSVRWTVVSVIPGVKGDSPTAFGRDRRPRLPAVHLHNSQTAWTRAWVAATFLLEERK